jgi:hypothetical protein
MSKRGRLITLLQVVILLSGVGAISWVAFMDPGPPVIEHVELIWEYQDHVIIEDGHFIPSVDTGAFGDKVSLIINVTVRRADPKRDFDYLSVVPERELIEQASFYQTGFAFPVEVNPGESITVGCAMDIPKESIERIRARFQSRGIGYLVVGKFTPEDTLLRVENGYWNPLLAFQGLRRIWVRMQ